MEIIFLHLHDIRLCPLLTRPLPEIKEYCSVDACVRERKSSWGVLQAGPMPVGVAGPGEEEEERKS